MAIDPQLLNPSFDDGAQHWVASSSWLFSGGAAKMTSSIIYKSGTLYQGFSVDPASVQGAVIEFHGGYYPNTGESYGGLTIKIIKPDSSEYIVDSFDFAISEDSVSVYKDITSVFNQLGSYKCYIVADAYKASTQVFDVQIYIAKNTQVATEGLLLADGLGQLVDVDWFDDVSLDEIVEWVGVLPGSFFRRERLGLSDHFSWMMHKSNLEHLGLREAFTARSPFWVGAEQVVISDTLDQKRGVLETAPLTETLIGIVRVGNVERVFLLSGVLSAWVPADGVETDWTTRVGWNND